MRVTGSVVSWRKTWDTCTPPFSATLTARNSARHHSYVQLKRGVLCCDIDRGDDRQRIGKIYKISWLEAPRLLYLARSAKCSGAPSGGGLVSPRGCQIRCSERIHRAADLDHSATGIGCGGDATAGSLSPPKRRRAVSRRPTAGTCFVAAANPKTGMLPYSAS
jgi:hypothetical protein